MALALAQTVTWANLERAHGRLMHGPLMSDLAQAWEFTFPVPVPVAGHSFEPIRRLLVARSVLVAEPATQEFGSATPS